MAGRIVRRTQARLDAIAAFQYYAQDCPAPNIDVAHRFLDSLESALAALAVMPEMGRPHENSSVPGVRWHLLKTPFHEWIVFYQPFAGGVRFMRVLHAKRDVDALLQADFALHGQEWSPPWDNGPENA